MAGNYPDVPANRLNWSSDGTRLLRVENGVVYDDTSQGVMDVLNDQSVTSAYYHNRAIKWVMMFPRLMDLSGCLIAYRNFGGESSVWSSLEWSANTFSGIDGTFTAVGGGNLYNGSPDSAAQRNSIKPMSILGARALRISHGSTSVYGSDFFKWHVYGVPSAGQNLDKLELWHPTLDRRLYGSELDWGDRARSSATDKTFRVKNTSPTLTANSITVSRETLTDASPSVVAAHLLSDDGVNFYTTRTITSLSPGAISSVLTVRQVLSASAQLGLWTLNLKATAASWT